MIRFSQTKIIIGYVFGVLLLGVLVLEAFVRVWLLPRDFLYFKVDTKEFPYFRLVEVYDSPGVTIRNSRREFRSRQGRQHKVAFIGDSNTFGTGSDDKHTYEEILQSSQTSWDTYNFGVPGYGLPELTRVIDSITAREHYDVIAYNYNFNDPIVAMAMYLPLLSSSNTRLSAIDAYEGLYGALKLFAKDHFKLLFVVPTVMYVARESKRLANSSDTHAQLVTSSDSRACFEQQLQAVMVDGQLIKPYRMYEEMYSDETLLTAIGGFFRRMKSIVEARGGRFLVFIHYDLPLMTHTVEYPQRNLKRILRENQISTLDTYSVYQQHYKECGFYFDYGHLGPKGNGYIAQLLAKYLAKRDEETNLQNYTPPVRRVIGLGVD